MHIYKAMKKLTTLILIIISLGAKADYWTQKANFPANGRSVSFSFSIGNNGYIGCGLDSLTPIKDFWEYGQLTNTWTQKADFGGLPRAG